MLFPGDDVEHVVFAPRVVVSVGVWGLGYLHFYIWLGLRVGVRVGVGVGVGVRSGLGIRYELALGYTEGAGLGSGLCTIRWYLSHFRSRISW